MRLTVRLYKRHDLDLLYLYKLKQDDFDFKDDMKSTLKEYVKGKPIKKVKVPEGVCAPVSSLPAHVQMHIVLDPKKDKEVLEWLKSITKGRRNNLIKNIYRNKFPVIDVPYDAASENHQIITKE